MTLSGDRGLSRARRLIGARLRIPGGWFVRDLLLVTLTALAVFAPLTQILWFVSTHEVDARLLVEVPEGASLRHISHILSEAGLVRDAAKFVLAARFLRLTNRLQAGTYEFGPEFTELGVLLALKYGEVAGRHVTIPEGYRASQIASLMETALGIDSAEFMELVHDPALISDLGLAAPSLEGYLHPDTYRLRLGTGAREAVEVMVAQTRRVFDERFAARAETLGFSLHEILTLASIIEAEAMIDSERSRISAVYHNRINGGWRLEADPTVRYAMGNYRRKLYYGDLDVASPYNTYRYAGLPPGPIGSPGASSIEAALYPLAGCRDFFFVANGDGTHTFSRTFEEHIRARRKIIRERGEGEFSLDTGVSG
jgi:UPF0755 protein